MGHWKRKRPKYGNTKVKEDGMTFDSKIEYRRWLFLKDRQSAGEIRDLVHHPKFPLILPNGVPVVIRGEKRNTKSTFTPDFSYYLTKDGVGRKDAPFVIEDVKSKITAAEAYFRFKKAVFEAIYDCELHVVFNAKEWKW